MAKRLSEIAGFLGGDVEGDGSIVIEGLADIEQARAGHLAFVANPSYAKWMKQTEASALLLYREAPPCDRPAIRVDNPHFAFLKAIELFHPQTPPFPPGIHETAVLGENVKLGKDVSLQAHVVMGEGVTVGDYVVVFPGVVVGNDCKIGPHSILYANVTLREGVTLGKNVIVHSGTVIGSDGFGYVQEGDVHHKVPQIGRVVIEDDVEIGANVAIDRATLGETRIKSGTKLDNLVHVAHNVLIGQNVAMAGQVGVSGSTVIGDGVMVAGQVGFVDHITIGPNTKIGAQSGVSKSLPPNGVYFGSPARPIGEAKRIEACHPKLPELIKLVRDQQRRIEELEKKLERVSSKDGELDTEK
ncbi:MAG: UDP-3-O-(3-hydroxymyristoyl)glucosamine N-acyltransferase [bacterium]